MAETLSLMEFLQALLTDPGLRGDFGDDPQGTLTAHGLADLTPADVHDALVLVQDTQTVDYSLDAATAPSPPPPAGDGHEAAVEYLARYLAGPQETAPAEQWADPDHHLGAAPVGGFGAGDDTGYGAGSGIPADEGERGDPDLESEPGTEPDPGTDPYPADDRAGYDVPDDLGDLGGFDEFSGLTGVPDMTGDLTGDEPDGHDAGPPLPDGA